MEDANTTLMLKRPINVKVIVTTRWKDEMQQQLQAQITQIDGQMQQLEMQGQRAISEIQKQSISPPGPEVSQQIDNIQIQVNQKKSEFLERKNQFLQQMQQVQLLELDQEVVQAQMESFFRLEQGDNLVKKLNVEIVLRDGVVEEIRGDI
ncbi:YlqD family protein [Crocosphaera sp. XPORK-15E]|uniref:YlqD family protein n=1 Tax=Crocosphaera sp. XPORK-15E TaxID=3110247 RepID=UPI002B201AE1|nr:YlqD family protein [Crocosphaera sp. XPORK-15E]MEA5534353.1 YlqD family protein [Crocosphaera sp. XPORK-15E]